ncbi:complex I intermediate-associated protein 30-domain-containing protein [Chytriomyces cf. hyalinus JEL632]|nr:complex I intermediate-associated protein 30-domain-containing protein [Chytriomyces cf. hyalinus JEL632]
MVRVAEVLTALTAFLTAAVVAQTSSTSNQQPMGVYTVAETLFGGELWGPPSQWTPVTDAVRGGSSTAALDIMNQTARFSGTLDTSTLGGAGFASVRRYVNFDLSLFSGIRVVVAKADGMRYSINLKNSQQERRPDGRLESSVEFKYNFETRNSSSQQVFDAPFTAFKPYYRGREVTDPSKMPKLDLSNIQVFSIMIQSYFDAQKGDYNIVFDSIAAIGE